MKEQQKNLPYSYEAEVVAAWREQLAEAAEKPWLAGVLLKHGERILRRFVHFYQRLRALPRSLRRYIQRKLALGLGAAALLLALSSIQAPVAFADTITVDANVDVGVVAAGNDGQCSLIEAITNANNDSQMFGDAGECVAGSGADTINLSASSTFTLTSANNGENGLPLITTPITIEGNGATIKRVSGAQFRIFAVNAAGDLTLNEATITGGNVAGKGGGIYSKGTLTVTNSTISGNSTSQMGGGIRNYEGTVTVQNSTISGNSAENDGGGIHNYNGTVTVQNSTISGNTAVGSGGGIFNHYYNGTLTVQNSTISGNSARDGGGINNGEYSTVYLNHSIVSGNTATGAGNEFNNSGPVTANDFNLFGHSGETDDDAFSGSSDFMGVSDIKATQDGTNTALTAILDTTLAANSGSTWTHALVADSPAIDHVPTSDADCNPGSSADQRGAARANGDNAGGSDCDVGAYEWGSDPPTAVTLASFGAETVPVDKVGLLALRLRSGQAPWMGLAGLVATAVAAVAARLRRGTRSQ